MFPVLCARRRPVPASAHNGDMTIRFLDLLHRRSLRGPGGAFVYDARFGEVGWRLAGQSGLERERPEKDGLGRTKRPRLAFPLHAPAGCEAAKFPKATLVQYVSPASAKRVAESGLHYRSGTRSRQKPVDKAGPTLARTVSICISIASRDWPTRLLREFPMGWSELCPVQPNALTGYGRDPASRFACPGAKSAQRLACDDSRPSMPVKGAQCLVQNSTYLALGGGGRAAPRAAPSTPLAASPAWICCYRGKQIMRLSRRSESALGPKPSLCAAFDRPSLALLDQNGDALSNVHRSLKRDLPRTKFCLMMTVMMKPFLLFLRFSAFSRKHDRADDHCPIWPCRECSYNWTCDRARPASSVIPRPRTHKECSGFF